LFLVGDIIDCWRLKSKIYWPQEHSNVIRNILSMAKNGTKVTYITGNHDDFLRIYQPLQLGNLELKEECEYESVSGKKLLVIHGDQFDMVTKYGKRLSIFGDKIYTFLLAFNKFLNFFRARLGFGYWSLAKYLKDLTKKAVNKTSNYEESLSKECKIRNLDGIVCGHIHKAQISVINGIDYFNCGDWVESATALIETMKDDLQQIAITLISQYGNEAQTIAMLRAAEHAASLNQDEWLKWEKIVQILETIDEKSPLDS
jgi:UDP-2,3-diacylglucosamine pyrophosphatase LpxH